MSAPEMSTSDVLGDFFRIQRGIATGANKFFIMTREQAATRGIPTAYLRPILPGPKYLEMDEIMADADGRPLLSPPQSLLDCPLSEAQIRAGHPDFWRYLQEGMEQIAQRYLCSHRSPWYSQERREPTFFLCSYIARRRSDGRLQRFIFNRSVAIAGNNYLMLYPRDSLARYVDGNVARARAVWRELCRIEPKALSHAGRVYAGGMHKLEPSELARVPAPGLAALLSGQATTADRSRSPSACK
jgi:adenine-specific DNA-methyltransferase